MTQPTKAEMTKEEAIKDALETLEEMRRWPNNPAEKRSLTLAIAALSKPKVTDEMVENAELRQTLSAIAVYGTDTLSGRVHPDRETYVQWLRDGIREMRDRARHGWPVTAALEGE